MTYPEADYSAGSPKRKAQCQKLAEVFGMNRVNVTETGFLCHPVLRSRLQPTSAAGR